QAVWTGVSESSRHAQASADQRLGVYVCRRSRFGVWRRSAGPLDVQHLALLRAEGASRHGDGENGPAETRGSLADGGNAGQVLYLPVAPIAWRVSDHIDVGDKFRSGGDG